MNFTQLRGTIYAGAAASVIGAAIMAAGYGTYDHATGELAIAFKVNLVTIVGMALGGGSPLLALLAVVRGWGGKK